MENTILHAARFEQQDLVNAIAVLDAEYTALADKRKQLAIRLAAVEALRAAYGDRDRLDAGEGLQEPQKAFAKAITVRENSHKSRVLNTAIDILKDGSQVRIQNLLAAIEKRGVEFNAKDKAGNLSVILSKDERFASDRRYGWKLKNETPQDAPTSAGSQSVQTDLQLNAPTKGT